MKLLGRMATILRADGSRERVAPANGSDFTLAELQAIVDGYIEILYFGDWLMVLNEDGKRDKKHNVAATRLALANLQMDDWIAGDVLFCPRSMVK